MRVGRLGFGADVAIVSALREELILLVSGGSLRVTENRDGVTEFCNHKQSLNQAVLRESVVRSPGFEPGLSAWEADVLTKLDYNRPQLRNQSLIL